MIVSTRKFVIWHGTISYVGLFLSNLAVMWSHLSICLIFFVFFLFLSCFFLDFLSKLFVKTLNSTGNSRKKVFFQGLQVRLTGFAFVICFRDSDFSDPGSDNNKRLYYTHWTFYTATGGKKTVCNTRRNTVDKEISVSFSDYLPQARQSLAWD